MAAPILIVWCLAPAVTAWLNAPAREEKQRLDSTDKGFLHDHALRIWRYFHQFSSERHNYLIPDNVEEEGLFEAARVSPTNVGLLLNARQAACELGFITAPEFGRLTERSLATIERLEKYRGHLYNWYDTETLKPLEASPFVSSVDSGNFIASLYTLRSGALELAAHPLVTRQIFIGLHAHLRLLQCEDELPARPTEFNRPGATASTAEWISWVREVDVILAAAFAATTSHSGDSWWREERRSAALKQLLNLLNAYEPWLLPEYAPLLSRFLKTGHQGAGRYFRAHH